MIKEIKRVAVLGSGIMGAQIAAQLANAGIPSYLFDMAPKELNEEEKKAGLPINSPKVRNRIVQKGLDSALQIKPAAFQDRSLSPLITIGNFEDDLPKIKDVDWIVEVVVENLAIKQSLLEQIDQHRKLGSIVTSNTSGISIEKMTQNRSEDLKQHFLGTHFFNPPRYLHLLEIIPGPKTLPEVLRFMAEFGDRYLGKGIVYCKDTPNFIANRIGVFGMMHGLHTMIKHDLTVEEVDALTGPIIGRPKSASLRTLDVVGLDTFLHVARNILDNVPQDPRREFLTVPAFVAKMLENKWLGSKTGQGFYKKEKEKILSLDYKTLSYRDPQKAKLPILEMAKNINELEERYRALLAGKEKASFYLWEIISETLFYSAFLVPEISEDIVNVDRAIKWGFGWELGPFEIWDALGVEKVALRMKDEGKSIPPLIEKLLSSSKKRFYTESNGKVSYFKGDGTWKEIDPLPHSVNLTALKKQNKVIKKNAGSSLIDLGDGVACLEFHSKMNAIGQDILSMIVQSERIVREQFEGLVIGNEGENFSVGANLLMLLTSMQEREWDEIDLMVRQFQKATMILKYLSKPVVAAPFQMVLGGGCEITMATTAVQAHAELYMGLVEVGVGLIPGGGGNKEMLYRCLPENPPEESDLFPFIRQAFMNIGMGQVSTGAIHARKMNFLRPWDGITMNRDRLIEDAKQKVLGLARSGYRPPLPRPLPALGRSGVATLKLGLQMMQDGGQVSAHDVTIGTQLARVLCGGDLSYPTQVSEQYMLDIEREAFLSLCGEPKTMERIQFMLKNNKPLRN
ncbi:MAG: 3-hydroxyacyl-CoA dehydrogenase/enoyl-CoA hydratase family protein [Planctomycetota bacterium]